MLRFCRSCQTLFYSTRYLGIGGNSFLRDAHNILNRSHNLNLVHCRTTLSTLTDETSTAAAKMAAVFGIEFADSIGTINLTCNEENPQERIDSVQKYNDRSCSDVLFLIPKNGSVLENMSRRVLVDDILKEYQSSGKVINSIHSAFRIDKASTTKDSNELVCEVKASIGASESDRKSLSSYIKGIAILTGSTDSFESQELLISGKFAGKGCPVDTYTWNNGQIRKNISQFPKIDTQRAWNSSKLNIESRKTHPLFSDDRNIPVYHKLEQAMKVLEECKELPCVSELLQRLPENLQNDEKTIGIQILPHPFVVVEGVDGSGKSTLVKNLAKHLNAVSLQTPPDLIKDLRKAFDGYPEMLRRAYYAIGNYIAEQEVLEYTQKQPVIMDRFWHSTTAYAIAKECNCGVGEHLPCETHPMYRWPLDLVQPSAVIFTFVPEEERSSRVNARKDLVTREEKELASSERFRKRLLVAYRRIQCNTWLEVETSGTEEQSLQKALSRLSDHNVLVP